MVRFNGGATNEPTNQSSASTTLTRPSLRSNSPPPPPLSLALTYANDISGGRSMGAHRRSRRWRGARVVQGSPWLCALHHVQPRRRNVRERKPSALPPPALCVGPLPDGTMRFIWIFGPHAPGTALCQGAPHSLLIVSPSHAHPWGAQPGLLCWLSGRSPTSKIKSYIESMLKVIKGCLQKRGSLKGRQATSTCLGALPTWSDPTSSGSTSKCATRVSCTYSLPLGIASL